MMRDMYWRNIRLIRVTDGDTVLVQVDAGFNCNFQQSIRLLDVDAPDLKGSEEIQEQGRAAKQFVIDWFREHIHGTREYFPFCLNSRKADRFGSRYLGAVVCQQDHSLSDDIISSGLARRYQRPESSD